MLFNPARYSSRTISNTSNRALGFLFVHMASRCGGTMSHTTFLLADASHVERFREAFGGERFIPGIAVAAARGSTGARAKPD
jgi:hypothetical protein